MLVLSRKAQEEIMIGDDIKILVRKISGNRVILGIEAPKGYRILRSELSRNQEESHERVERKSSCAD